MPSNEKVNGVELDFLRDILSHPGDGGPVLVFADWLEERGDCRGELLRLNLLLASGPNAFLDQRRKKLVHLWLQGGPLFHELSDDSAWVESASRRLPDGQVQKFLRDCVRRQGIHDPHPDTIAAADWAAASAAVRATRDVTYEEYSDIYAAALAAERRWQVGALIERLAFGELLTWRVSQSIEQEK
jgi:uncharacterized protein (TIGR02996 family)